MLKGTYSLVLTLVLLMSPCSKEVLSKESVEKRFLELTRAFRDENGLTQSQLDKLLFEQTVKKRPLINKGALGDGVYIALQNKQNKLFVDKRTWLGANRSVVQVVMTDGDSVFTAKQNVNLNKIKVVVFMPDQVQIVDFSQNEGWSMPRP